MRKLSFILLILSFHISYSQVVNFQFKKFTPCDKEGKIDSSDYVLIDNNGVEYKNKSGTVSLPRTGKYKMYRWSQPFINPVIDIDKAGLFIYSDYEPKIVVRLYGMHSYSVYEACGKPINGYEEDFYSNGNTRIRGNFVNGMPKDSLVTFYSNGAVNRRIIYLPKELFIKEYDSLNHLIKVSHNSNKFYYLTDYKKTEYYTDGTIRLKESSIARLVKIKEYYPGGKLKTIQAKKKRIEYYKNGRKKIIYTWKYKKEKFVPGEYDYDYRIIKRTFDENGELTELQDYDNRLKISQPDLEFSRSDWINKWIKWESGKEIILANDIDSKEYFKSNSKY